jgi:hypothetical protein
MSSQDAKDIITIKAKLTKLNEDIDLNQEEIFILLNTVETLATTSAQITTTKIGDTILYTTQNSQNIDKVHSKARQVLKGFRQIIETAKASSAPKSKSKPKIESAEFVLKILSNKPKFSASSLSGERKSSFLGLKNALSINVPSTVSSQTIEDIALQIEASLSAIATEKLYSNKIRSLIFNIRNNEVE